MRRRCATLRHGGRAGLQLPEVATTVKLHEGKRLVQDGPYADTKEQLGGISSSTCRISIPRSTGLRAAGRAGSVIEVRPNLPPMH